MIGKVLGNRYEIVEKIGEGGMAIVYKAKCSLLNRYVAVKILRHEFINDDEFIEKFRREAQAAASLSHPNIVSVYDVGVEGDVYYIVMEYINGKTLKDIIKEKGKLSNDETLDIAMKVVDALINAHSNKVIHRDIKPHNIMVTGDGRVKVTDFGIARAATSSTITSTNSVIGSAHYFSPEQARGGYTDEKSDIYSVGIMMYEMCTGKLPFSGDSPVTIAIKHIQEEAIPPTQVDSTVPSELEKVIMKCIEKAQNLRYKNSEELLNELRNVKKGIKNEPNNILDFDDSKTQVMPTLDDTVLMSKTEVISAINGDEPKMTPKRVKPKKIKPQNKSKSSKKSMVSAILLALVVVLIGSGMALGFGGMFSKSDDITIPDLMNLTELEAEEQLKDLGLRIKVVAEIESEQEKGYIIEQVDRAGEKVKKGYEVKVKISSGKIEEFKMVPDVFGKNINEAERILRDEGFEIVKVKYEDSEYEEDTVISQSPGADREVEEGAKIELVVSRGKKIKTVRTPNLESLKEREAQVALEAVGLKIGNVKSQESDEEEGKIISQNPKSGIMVQEGTVIEITISKGRKQEPIEVEEVEKSKVESIKLPSDRGEMVIRVAMEKNGVIEDMYSGSHNSSEGEVSVRVTGKGTSTMIVYIDGEVYEKKDIKF